MFTRQKSDKVKKVHPDVSDLDVFVGFIGFSLFVLAIMIVGSLVQTLLGS